MSINPIQFQRGLSLPDFLSQYGTEALCESALEKVRWRDGFRCPQWGHDHCTVFRRGQQPLYQCSACHHQTSLRVGTLFQASKLPLTTWFLAIYLITQAKNGVSALALMRSLGISWRAAWRLKHKILRAMQEREADRVLRGRVEVQACLRPRDRFWDIPVPKIDSAFDNLLVPQTSWSPSTTQQLRKLVA
ncbi:IS1595 family transposase, partial [Thiolapillus sp.]|uniref:IS1595 family transposase n=5 Tax=Thiolapillus sp. TaxID=2017437 RepID=UPI0025F3BF60